jgi:hypothetical protein
MLRDQSSTFEGQLKEDNHRLQFLEIFLTWTEIVTLKLCTDKYANDSTNYTHNMYNDFINFKHHTDLALIIIHKAFANTLSHFVLASILWTRVLLFTYHK